MTKKETGKKTHRAEVVPAAPAETPESGAEFRVTLHPVKVKETPMAEVFSVKVLNNIESLHGKVDIALAELKAISAAVTAHLPVSFPAPAAPLPDPSLPALHDLAVRVSEMESTLDKLGLALEEALGKLDTLVRV